MQDPYDGDPSDYQWTDPPEALAHTQRHLKRLRPRQPQLDLAAVQQCLAATAHTTTATGISKAHLLYAIAASWLCGIAVGASALYVAAPRILAADATSIDAEPHAGNRAPIDAQPTQREDASEARPTDPQPQHRVAADQDEQRRSRVASDWNERDQRVSFDSSSSSEALRATSWRQWEQSFHAVSLPLALGRPSPWHDEPPAPSLHGSDAPPSTKGVHQEIESRGPSPQAPSGPIPHRQWLEHLINHPADLL
jgi:hypothetical protein